MFNRVGNVAVRWTAFGCAAAVLWLTIPQVLELVAPLDANPIACSLIRLGASLLVGLAAYVSTRASARSRRIVDSVMLLGTVTVVMLVWRHVLHGVASAVWAISSGAHAGPPVPVEIVPTTDVCINGHVVHGVPGMWGCFGRIGSQPDSYYRGYSATLYFAYGLLPRARQCGPQQPS